MATEEEKDAKNENEMREQLKKQVDAIIGEFQGDIDRTRHMGGSKHAFYDTYDDVFEEVEKVFVNSVRQGKAMKSDDGAYEAIGGIVEAVVQFLEETAFERIKLDKLVLEKCEKLANGNRHRPWTKEHRTKVEENATPRQLGR